MLLYFDFFDETIQVRTKFTIFLKNSTLKNTICFLKETGNIEAINIIAGNDKKYIEPIKAKLARKLTNGPFFF
jgi:hypothetical protein